MTCFIVSVLPIGSRFCKARWTVVVDPSLGREGHQTDAGPSPRGSDHAFIYGVQSYLRLHP